MTNFNRPLLLDLAEFSVDLDRTYFEFFKHIHFRVKKMPSDCPRHLQVVYSVVTVLFRRYSHNCPIK